MSSIYKFFHHERGATAIEYGLLAALISVVLIVVLGQIGDNFTATWKIIIDAVFDASKT